MRLRCQRQCQRPLKTPTPHTRHTPAVNPMLLHSQQWPQLLRPPPLRPQLHTQCPLRRIRQKPPPRFLRLQLHPLQPPHRPRRKLRNRS